MLFGRRFDGKFLSDINERMITQKVSPDKYLIKITGAIRQCHFNLFFNRAQHNRHNNHRTPLGLAAQLLDIEITLNLALNRNRLPLRYCTISKACREETPAPVSIRAFNFSASGKISTFSTRPITSRSSPTAGAHCLVTTVGLGAGTTGQGFGFTVSTTGGQSQATGSGGTGGSG